MTIEFIGAITIRVIKVWLGGLPSKLEKNIFNRFGSSSALENVLPSSFNVFNCLFLILSYSIIHFDFSGIVEKTIGTTCICVEINY